MTDTPDRWYLRKVGFFGHKTGTCDACSAPDVLLWKVVDSEDAYQASVDSVRRCGTCAAELVAEFARPPKIPRARPVEARRPPPPVAMRTTRAVKVPPLSREGALK